MASTKKPAAANLVSFDGAISELEALVVRLESGELPLEELLVHYQRGAELLVFCRTRLDAVQDQIKLLDGATLSPWSVQA
jgi:exodeoxyribonuclease VII small subunit